MVDPNQRPDRKALTALVRLGHNLPEGNPWIFALAWLGAARLYMDGALGDGATAGAGLLDENVWRERLHPAGLPSEAVEAVWREWGSGTDAVSLNTTALALILSLAKEQLAHTWDVVDAPWGNLASSYFQTVCSPELADLSVELLQGRVGQRVWIPFDPAGQFCVRAIRRGLRPIVAGPGRNSDLIARLMLLIHFGTGYLDQAHFNVEPDSSGRRRLESDLLICMPPLGHKLIQGSGWRQWEYLGTRAVGLGTAYENGGQLPQIQFDRSEAWSIAAFWPRISERAVFVVTPSVLFAKGQEQRLRQQLLQDEQLSMAVITLPTRQFEATALAPALLILDRRPARRRIRFVDAKEAIVERRMDGRVTRVLDMRKVAHLAESNESSGSAIDVSTTEVSEPERILLPSRYLAPSLSNEVPRMVLGELVSAIKSPPVVGDAAAEAAIEIGVSNLDQWTPIEVNEGVGRPVQVTGGKLRLSALREGDLILSVKGTLGKAAMLGALGGNARAVPAANCIGLRLRAENITPEFLLLYLRSDEFKAQLESIRVGASIPHVTTNSLLLNTSVPIPALSQLSSYKEMYEELCRIEAEIRVATRREEELRKALWPLRG
jgi:hypothetical protein